MGVYIKGMTYADALRLLAKDKKIIDTRNIIEVKEPHGRLIDADFEEAHYTSMTTNPTPDVSQKDKENSLIIVKALQMARTVIEREGE